MEAMFGISLYSFPYLNYVFSSTKLEIRAEQVLSGSEAGDGVEEKWRGEKSPKQ
jgi:hypothetical protein